MSHDLPAGPPKRRDDRNDAASPSVVQVSLGRRGQPDTSSPGDAALVALVKLIARKTAEEDFRSRGE